jgi:aminoglycoside 6'-N-acetyltransferase
VKQWLELSDIEPFWGHVADIQALFTRAVIGSGHCLVYVDSEPVGYVRWRHDDGNGYRGTLLERPLAVGATRIDALVGPRDRRLVGLGSIALRMTWERLDMMQGSTCYFGLASVHQVAAIRAYEKAGFRYHYYHNDVLQGPSVALVRPTEAQAKALLRRDAAVR